MSNFAFLAAEFPAVHEAAVEAERQAAVSPTAAAFFAGKAVEIAVKWAFRTDPGLKLPYQDNIAAPLHEPSFRVEEVAPLPLQRTLGTEDAKRFDLLMFSLELALLKGSKRFDTLKKHLLEIASALEDQMGIPAIAHQAVLIEEIQTDLWWEGVTVPLFELVRLRLRDLIQHIEKSKRVVVYSNFADEIGDGVEHVLPQVGEADFARFKQKARHFLKAHEDHIVLHKLRQGKPLTPTDLGELEKMLLDAGIGEAGDIERARETSQGFGRFVRSVVGLDRAAVRDAFGEFLAAGVASAAQIEFINMVIEHLTDLGVMDPELLYEPPFTDVAPTGPEQLFDEEKVTRLFTRIKAINDSAVARGIRSERLHQPLKPPSSSSDLIGRTAFFAARSPKCACNIRCLRAPLCPERHSRVLFVTRQFLT